MAESKPEHTPSSSEKDVKATNILDKPEKSPDSPRHQHETHGRSDDIDEDTSTDEVKGPNVFERIKEEFEAIAGAIHPQKESSSEQSLLSDC